MAFSPEIQAQIRSTEEAMNRRAPCGHWQHNARSIVHGFTLSDDAIRAGKAVVVSVAPANAPERVERFEVLPGHWIEAAGWFAEMAWRVRAHPAH